MGLIRQVLKPLYRSTRDAEYREYLRIKSKCRNKAGQHVVVTIDGYTIEGNDGPSLLYQYEEIVGRKSFDFTSKNASPVIYCCGANIGIEVVRFAHQYPKGKIKAFEPDPELFELLKKNVEQNGLSAELFNAAVSTHDGMTSFQSDGKLGGKIGKGSAEVKTIRLRDLMAKEQTIDLLIMDIEGAENAVVPDIADQLGKVKHFFLEWHGPQNRDQNLQEILALLKQHGFRYRLNNNLGAAPFQRMEIENGFDAMVEIYATRSLK